MKRTYQPSRLVRKRRHGFRSKMRTKGGKKLLARRRSKGRKKLTVQMSVKLLSLKKNEDFKTLLKGRILSNKYLTIFFKTLSDKSNKNLNISFVVQKKLGNAVKRNKIKRRLKNLMNKIVKETKINLNYSYLFIAKKEIINANFSDIKETILKNCKKIK